MYTKGKIVVLPTRKLLIIDIIDYRGNKLAFCDHVSEDETKTLDNYVIMLIKDDNLYEVLDENVKKEVLPIFEKNIQNEIDGVSTSVEG